jgi:4a-hydroxytetrahydrobiopterin dehydratase
MAAVFHGNRREKASKLPTMNPILPTDQLQKHLNSLPDWHYQPDKGGSISKDYRFADFAQAFAFMGQMAAFSETIQHHPEWFNVYNRVSVRLTTHDSGGVTELDLRWAQRAEEVVRLVGLPGGNLDIENHRHDS